MNIMSRELIRAAIERVVELDPSGTNDDAIDSAAQSLGIPVELVRAALEPVGEDA